MLSSRSGRLPTVRVELRWLMPRALPQAIAMCFGNTWRPIPVYMRQATGRGQDHANAL